MKLSERVVEKHTFGQEQVYELPPPSAEAPTAVFCVAERGIKDSTVL